jgi:death on curing protein
VRYLTARAVEEINAASAPAVVVINPGHLDAAINRPQITVGGQDAFPSIHSKAAALLHGLTLGHPFLHANKRTAWLAACMFYELNAWQLNAVADEAVAFMLDVAKGTKDIPSCAAWLDERATPIADLGGS